MLTFEKLFLVLCFLQLFSQSFREYEIMLLKNVQNDARSIKKLL